VAQTRGDELTVSIDGKPVGAFKTEGVSHDHKTLVSLTTKPGRCELRRLQHQGSSEVRHSRRTSNPEPPNTQHPTSNEATPPPSSFILPAFILSSVSARRQGAGGARNSSSLPSSAIIWCCKQKQTNPIWGWDTPGTKVTVNFGDQTKSGEAGADGKWTVKLDPVPANAKPQTISIAGTNKEGNPGRARR